MNKQENAKIIAVLKSNYINFYSKLNEMEVKIMLQTWYEIFEDVPYQVMLGAVKEYMITHKSYPPTVADIMEIISGKITGNIDVAEESFDKIYKLVSRCGSDRFGFEKAQEHFTDIERACITEGYWKDLGQSNPEDKPVLVGQYRGRYNNAKDKFKKEVKIGISDKELLTNVNKKLIGKGE